MKKPAPRRRDSLSRERIVDAAIAILDRDGEDALTFRGLAAHFSTGAGALYHYVAGKDELLSAATNRVITDCLSEAPEEPGPVGSVRGVAVSLWRASEAHPWLGSTLYDDPTRMTAAQIYEAIGSRLSALGVPPDEQFDVCAAIGSYIFGNISQQSANARLAKVLGQAGYDRESYLTEFVKVWRELDPGEYPFVHGILERFPTHDDEEQYLAGIDLLLAGISARYPAP